MFFFYLWPTLLDDFQSLWSGCTDLMLYWDVVVDTTVMNSLQYMVIDKQKASHTIVYT